MEDEEHFSGVWVLVPGVVSWGLVADSECAWRVGCGVSEFAREYVGSHEFDSVWLYGGVVKEWE